MADFHGYDDEGEYAKIKVWSVDDCQRNRFQLGWLCGEDVYQWFDRPLIRHQYRPLCRDGVPHTYMPHQHDLSDAGLTYHYQIFGAEMGTGKTLAAQMVMEMSGVDVWWWAGPKTSLPNIKRELKLWGFPADRIQVEFFTYEGLVNVMDQWDGSEPLPRAVHRRRIEPLQELHIATLAGQPDACRSDSREIRLRRLRDRDVGNSVAEDPGGLVEPVRDRLARFPQGRQPAGDGRAAGLHGRAAIRRREVQEAHRLEGRLRGSAPSVERRSRRGRTNWMA